MTLKGSKKDDKPEFWPEILRSCIDDIHSGGGRFFQQLGAQEMMQIVQDVTTTDFTGSSISFDTKRTYAVQK